MAIFKAKTEFDRVFEVSILLKAADGLLEVMGGIILLFISPRTIINFVTSLTANELSTDPHDFIANHILDSAHALTAGSLLFGAIYLLAHGFAKIILVIEILRSHLWAYIGLIIFTAIFIVYQVYRISYTHSLSLILLTIFDIFIIYITWREYKKQKPELQKAAKEDESV
ncbi:MAG TPA: DUF2127 domain-containing protein [Patescibacteria group bacterium]|nr:DUF2127 domain-containing protein [Patescibacteria group bacterium]